MSTFSGPKETCSNYQNGELNMSHDQYEQTNVEIESPDMPFEQTCFNICGPDHYIENIGTRSVCQTCPSKPAGWTVGTPEGETQEITNLRGAGLLGMCRDFNQTMTGTIPEWFTRQQAANIQQNYLETIDWSSDIARTLWSQYSVVNGVRPAMNDQQLLAMFGTRVPGEFNEDNTPIFTLPPKYGDQTDQSAQLADLKVKINTGRGSVVDCMEDNKPAWVTCSSGKFGVNSIIYEEANDYWLSEFDRLDPETETDESGIRAFSDLLSGLSIDSNFESCVNEVLNTGEDDHKIQQRILNYKKITDFGNEDLNYLQAKLRRIILVKEPDVNECMNMLNISESVCTTGVSDKMLQIGHLVFSIIGANKIELVELDIDDRYHLNKMVTKLGPLLPRAIKNIIHISKEYETRICNKPSNTTLLLERLYLDLYDNQVNVELNVSPYLGFSELIDTPNTMSGFLSYMKTLIPILCLGLFILVLLKSYWERGMSVIPTP